MAPKTQGRNPDSSAGYQADRGAFQPVRGAGPWAPRSRPNSANLRAQDASWMYYWYDWPHWRNRAETIYRTARCAVLGGTCREQAGRWRARMCSTDSRLAPTPSSADRRLNGHCILDWHSRNAFSMLTKQHHVFVFRSGTGWTLLPSVVRMDLRTSNKECAPQIGAWVGGSMRLARTCRTRRCHAGFSFVR